LKKIDIILPAYNPTSHWPDTIVLHFQKLEDALKAHSISLIIVDDGSHKPMAESVNTLNQKIGNITLLTHKKNKGKGAALRTGIAAAKSDIILFTDIDFPYTTASVVNIVKALEEKQNTIAIGKRNNTYYDNIPRKRAWISRVLKTTIKTVLRLPAYDTQCGLKAFRKEVKDLFLSTKTNRYLVDLEFLRLANRRKEIKITPVLVDLREGIELSEVSAKLLLNESWSFVKILFR